MPGKAYFDTFVFMDLLAGGEYAEKAKKYLQEKGVVSSILLTEIGFHVSRRKRSRADEILFYIQSLPNIEVVPVTTEVAMLAGKLRAKYRKKIKKQLTYFDSIHLATAINQKCTRFITGDRGFEEIKEIPVEVY
ncbi:MAG: PIN domain-containing protein [Candidatus Aenigmarchaeota archaeon]|nr:PIN domain-containing protein [Candidatus Aenigmarchaeota archaeon]